MNRATIIIGNGNVTVDEGVLTGTTLIIGNGSDNITLDAGSTNDTIKLGNGNDTLNANNLSFSTITAGNGTETITANGDGNTITVGSGNSVITAKGKGDTIKVGDGSNTITTGGNATITIGNGNDVVTAGANSTIQAGDHGDNGKDTVTAGPHSTITLGDGNDTVFAGSDSTITVGNGTAAIHAGTSDTITIGHGADLIKYDGLTPTFTVPLTLTVDEEGNVNLPITIGPPALGHEVVNGFRTQQDVIAFDQADFADFNAVKTASAQVGADVVITLDSGDTVKLTNVSLASLSPSNFQFFTGATDTITITGIPSDETLSAGTKNADGSWSLTPAQLTGLKLNAGEPVGYPTPVDLQTTITNPAGQGASATHDTNLTVDALPPTVGVAVLANLSTDPVTETRLNISAAPDDADGSGDHIDRVVLSNIPTGVTLSHNGVAIAVDGSGHATIAGSNFGAGAGGSYEVDVTTPDAKTTDFNLGITAYSDEPNSPEQSAATSQNIDVEYSKYSTNQTFHAVNQSQWDTGTAFIRDFDNFIGTTLSASGGFHVGTTLTLTILGVGTTLTLTAGAHASASLKAGFQSDLHINSGSINADLPFNVTIGETDNKTTNRLLIDPKETQLSGGDFHTLSPNGSYELDFILNFMASATLSALGDSTHLSTHFGTTLPLVSFNSSKLKTTVNLPDGLGSATFQWPTINVDATDGPGTITGTGTSAPIFQLSLDPIAAILDAVFGEDPLKGTLFGGAISYTLLSSTVAPGVNLSQTFSLSASGLTPTLTAQHGTVVPFTFGTPEILSNASSYGTSFSLNLTPDAQLENETSLGGQLVLGIKLLQGSVSLSGLFTTGFGPVANPKTTLQLGNLFDLYDKTFALNFQPKTTSVSIV